jgi:NADP-dependent 3-hydroxy acid dehydrogenase YdfG
MLLGPVVDADPDEWDRMIAINTQGLLYTTHAALPYLLKAAEDGPRQVADIINISSIAGRVASNGFGVYNMTKDQRSAGTVLMTTPCVASRMAPVARSAWTIPSRRAASKLPLPPQPRAQLRCVT